MPSKGKQRASRQAQLRSRRKRGKSQVVDSRRDQSEPQNIVLDNNSPSSSISTHSPVKNAGPNIRATPAPSHSTTLSYPYLGSELKRIAIVSGIVVVALLGFSFI